MVVKSFIKLAPGNFVQTLVFNMLERMSVTSSVVQYFRARLVNKRLERNPLMVSAWVGSCLACKYWSSFKFTNTVVYYEAKLVMVAEAF